MKKMSISVGIPAYNEEGNIRKLLQQLVKQKSKNFVISDIFVVSDGSSDETVKRACSVRDKRIHVLASNERRGKTFRCNQLLRMSKGDAIILVDADISLENDHLFSLVLHKYSIRKHGLIAVGGLPYPAQNIFGKIMNYSVDIQNRLVRYWNKGDNYLGFRGFLIFLSKKAASDLVIQASVNNDAYIYFYLKSKGFNPKYYFSSSHFFKSPSNFRDYLNQSSRFQNSKLELGRLFPGIEKEYAIPKSAILKTVIVSFFYQPVLFVSYMSVLLFSRILKMQLQKGPWELAKSTKYTL